MTELWYGDEAYEFMMAWGCWVEGASLHASALNALQAGLLVVYPGYTPFVTASPWAANLLGRGLPE